MYRSGFNREVAEDLLMDIVFKAFKNFSKFDPDKGSFKTWIFAIAHNHLINSWREKRRKQSVSLDQLEEEGFSPAYVESGNSLENQIEKEKIQKALSHMTEVEREVINLRYFQDLSFEEVSKITGKNEAAIRKQLSRARQHLGDLYEKFYPQVNE